MRPPTCFVPHRDNVETPPSRHTYLLAGTTDLLHGLPILLASHHEENEPLEQFR